MVHVVGGLSIATVQPQDFVTGAEGGDLGRSSTKQLATELEFRLGVASSGELLHGRWGLGLWRFWVVGILPKKSKTGWWFQICFDFHPYLGKIPILTNIFQMGWNHQLENVGSKLMGHKNGGN